MSAQIERVLGDGASGDIGEATAPAPVQAKPEPTPVAKTPEKEATSG